MRMSGDQDADNDEVSPCRWSSSPPTPYSSSRVCCCPSSRSAVRLANENLLVLNVIQFLCGVGAIVLSGVAISNQIFLNQLATGMWSGGIMLVTGIHGIVTARRKGLCTLIALLVLCVLAALTATILACVSVAGLVNDHSVKEPLKVPAIVLHALLLVVGCLDACVSITTTVLCSRQICLYVVTGDEAGQTYVITNPGGALGRAELSANVSEVLLRNVARRGPLPVTTGSGGQARASVLFVVPSRNNEEPMLLFPPFPPAYSSEEPRPLLPPSGPDAYFRPALVLAEDPPPYSTLERRTHSRPVSEAAAGHPSTSQPSAGNRVHLRTGRRIISSPLPRETCLQIEPPPPV